jgi:chloramphenicol O-acetyltransferase type A
MAGDFLDLSTWPRREQFLFFRGFDNPFFNICAELNVTELYRLSRAPDGPSFFLLSLFLSLRAANEVDEFRHRIRGGGIWRHDRIHASATVLRDDETFGFAYFDFVPDFQVFEKRGRSVIDQVRKHSGPLDPRDERDDLIHYSVLPWIRFTSFSHARRWGTEDSVPKIVFGKHFNLDGKRWMPISVEVHHALVDGLHVARFLERFQGYLDDSPQRW